jgi:putative ABC transport system permease protein
VRRRELRLRLSPLVAAAIVAGFLLLMVGLGLVGVLWQNVTRRTQELGLRRAVGAHRGSVHRQILLELMLITTIGIALGVITVIQLPLLAVWEFLTMPVMVAGLAVALLTIYLIAALAGFYPSWMATRVQPAEALHYE